MHSLGFYKKLGHRRQHARCLLLC